MDIESDPEVGDIVQILWKGIGIGGPSPCYKKYGTVVEVGKASTTIRIEELNRLVYFSRRISYRIVARA